MKHLGSVMTMAALGLVAIGIHTAAAQESVLVSFGTSATEGSNPDGSLIFDAAGNLYGTTYSGGAHGAGAVIELSPAEGGGWTEQVLWSFDSATDGQNPLGSLVLDQSGNLYGTTSFYGPNLGGVAFELSPGTGGVWTEQVLHSFAQGSQTATTDGDAPEANLILDAEGNLYGTTTGGGMDDFGTVFELVKPSAGGVWTENILHYFSSSSTDGRGPLGGLIFDAEGNLYGTTSGGGASGLWGTVFELSPGTGGVWTEKLLWSFGVVTGDGVEPEANLVFDAQGNLYGTTKQGGTTGDNTGTVFELSPGTGGTWTEKLLWSFAGGASDGSEPVDTLIFDAQGDLYGTTQFGPHLNNAIGIYGGTVFELTPAGGGSWTENILASLQATSTDGGFPEASLIADTAGNLYGTTYYGGANSNNGTVFEMAAAGLPAFSTPGGAYHAVQSTTITSGTSNAKIYYTTDGTTPTAASTEYTEEIAVPGSETIKAVAIAPGLPNSAVVTQTYTITLASALTSPTAGSTFTGSSASFTWNAGLGVSYYWLTVGTGPSGASARNIYAGSATTAQSANVTGLPIYGQTIYVTLSSEISGAWQSTVYTFIASGSPVAALLTSPAANSQLASSSVTFNWTAGGGVTYYWLNLGTGPSGANAKNIYNSGSVTALSETVSGLPTNGEDIYATLYSYIGGAFQPTVYAFYATGPAVLTAPSPATKLTASTTFAWTPGIGITTYWLNVGTGASSSNAKDIYSSGPITTLSKTVTGIPTYGSTLYVTLYSLIAGVYQPIVYTYTASGSPVASTLTTPTPSTKLASSSVTFTWSGNEGVTYYWFNLGTGGSGANAKNLYSGSSTTLTSATATGLPTNGETIYATLYSYIAGTWQPTVYTYTASGSPSPAVLTTPGPTTQLTSSTVTFSWSAGNPATYYWFNLGTASSGPNTKNIYSGGSTTATSVTVNNLPTNGETIYATLYSYIDGAWQPTVYTYTAQ